MQIIIDEYDFEKEPRCCGGCLTVHTGIKVLGFYSIVKTIIMLGSGLRMAILNDDFFGIYLIAINAVFIL